MVTSLHNMTARDLPPEHVSGSISPSQIKTFDLCPRKWGYEKLAGLESPSGPAADLGTRVHAVGEAYFRTGAHPANHKDTEAAHIFEAMMPHYPSFSDATFEVEQHINAHFEGIDFHGFQDLGFLTGRAWAGEEDPIEPRYVVCDHKTTGDFRWAKTAEDLDKDPQALIYALAAMQRLGVDDVELRWVYGRTRGAIKSTVARLVVDRALVERGMHEIVVPTARLIKKARDEGATAEDMPQNPSACRHYGGCPFVANCNLSPLDRLKAEFNMSSLRERIAANKAAQAGEVKAADAVKAIETPDNTTAPINPPEQRKPGSLVAALATGKPQGVAASTNAAPAAPAAPGSLAEKMAKLRAQKTGAPAPSESPTKAPEAATAASAPTEAPKATTVPPKVEEKTSTERVARHEAETVAEPTVMFIGCVVIGDHMHNASEIANMAHQEFCHARRVADYRMIQYTGAAEFLAFFEASVALRMPAGYVFADLNNPFVKVLLPAMERFAKRTIRAVQI